MGYSSNSFSNPFGFSVTTWVKRLLILNGALFLVTLALPILVPYLALTPSRVLSQPWTLLTYMFVHGGVFHLLFNLLGLFFFGTPLEERWGSREFLKYYLIAGLGGALLSLVLFRDAMTLGASGAIFGLLVAYAMYWPDNPIYLYGIFPVKAKWLVLIYVAIDLISVPNGGSGVANLAHLGGAAAGFLYLKSRLAPSPFGQVARPKRPKREWKVFSSGGGEAAARKEAPAAAASRARTAEMHRALDEVDRILDKISAAGIGSLTEEERKRLDEASRKFRSN